MKKSAMGAKQLLNPRPVVLVGTVVDGKPNFITVSWTGLTSATPPTMSIAIRNSRYSLNGINNNKTFSVNVPSSDLVNQTDYCGNVSGCEHDKASECGFTVFKGLLDNAPLIKECPINIECRVIKSIQLGDHTLFIGEIIESYISEECFTNGIPDIKKVDLLCYCNLTANEMGYFKIGDPVEPK
ncbi:MAG: flavin reductase family protein [Melioribacteraceae bacterium]|nr:flavin reductase family protein [Melioribacteraceae bacterium]